MYRRPQKSSSNHVAGLGVMRSLKGIVRLRSVTGSMRSGVQGIWMNVPSPVWAAFVPRL